MKKIYGRLMLIVLISLFLFLYILTLGVNAANNPNSYIITVAQQEVRGVVSDQNGMPLPGVTVLVKGKNKGTTTNIDGEYSITIEPGDILIFSFLGYKTLEEPVNGRREIVIQLEEDISTLGEVQINAGYYNTTRRESTGNISRVTAEEIELQPVVSPLQALQGRMAGVEIVQPNGIPGTAPTIRIRGQNSLRNNLGDNGNLPLYIINGVPINSNPLSSSNFFSQSNGIDPLSTLDLSNIQSIEVLKDADATAIYGSRGANGVILITTKTGDNLHREMRVEARIYSGISQVSHFVDLLNTQEYLSLRREAFQNDMIEPTAVNARDIMLWDQNRYTNWQKEFFGGTASTTNASFNISGGNDNTNFLLGGSYFNQGTVFPGDYSYTKKTTNLNLNHKSSNDKFRFNLSVNYGLDNNDLFSSTNFVSSAFNLPPNAPEIFDENGDLNWENSSWTNPFAVLNSEGLSTTTNLIANLGIQYQLNKNFRLNASLGYTSLDREDEIKQPLELYNPALWDRISPRSIHSNSKRDSWIFEPQLSYNKTFHSHNLDILVGATFQQNDDHSLNEIGIGYSHKHFIGNLAAADAVAVTQDRNTIYKYNALFGRLGYNYNYKYFLNFTGRRDGSSRFGPDKRFSNFGAIGAAWIFQKENFIEDNLSFLSFGKLRGSFGITGNDQIGDYRYLDAYMATPGPGGLYPTRLTNPDFSWEKNRKLEAGMELGFLTDRISLNVSWFRNRSSNQLVGYPLPAITGFSTVEANLPALVENSGWEIEFSSLNIQKASFNWRTSLNLTIPKTRLLSFPGIQETSYWNTYRVGEPLSLALLFQYQGINPDTGLYEVLDINEDGTYDNEDRIVYENVGRIFYGGIKNQVNYKGFSLDFLFEFVKQNGRLIADARPGSFGNTVQGNFDVWRTDQTDTNVQKATNSIPSLLAYNRFKNSSAAITDASFLRLKTLSFGYNVPNKILDHLKVIDFQIFVHTQNLFTITDYTGLDPQNPESIVLPELQSITGGIQLTF